MYSDKQITMILNHFGNNKPKVKVRKLEKGKYRINCINQITYINER